MPKPEYTVFIGTSAHTGLCEALVGLAARLSPAEAAARLARGDDPRANRVLHVCVVDGRVAGCISSTLQPMWTPAGCGHWGLLVVAPAMRRKGIACALVHAAEERLRAGGCNAVQIEYEWAPGYAHGQVLEAWYEGRLRFERISGAFTSRLFGLVIGHHSKTEFRRCRRSLSSGGGATARTASTSDVALPTAGVAVLVIAITAVAVAFSYSLLGE